MTLSSFSAISKFTALAAIGFVLYLFMPQIIFFKQAQIPEVTEFQIREAAAELALPAQAEKKGKDALVALGKALFFDRRLSRNGEVACSSCHDPKFGFSDNRPVGVGLAATSRNTPTLANISQQQWFFWDGRADSLAAQSLGPIENTKEHGISRTGLIKRVVQNHSALATKAIKGISKSWLDQLPDEAYPDASLAPREGMPLKLGAYALYSVSRFAWQSKIMAEGFGEKSESPARRLAQQLMQAEAQEKDWIKEWNRLSAEDQSRINHLSWAVMEAFAAFQSTIHSSPAAFDHFAERLKTAPKLADALGNTFGSKELEGFKIFVGQGRCILCHNTPTLSDGQFHNTGLEDRNPSQFPDVGRARGLVLVRADIFNCRAGIAPQTTRESCLELERLNDENIELVGAFRTPTLRHLKQTAPYGHDGRFKELSEVLDFYNHLPDKPAVGHREESLIPLNLDAKQQEALQAFLLSLDSSILY